MYNIYVICSINLYRSSREQVSTHAISTVGKKGGDLSACSRPAWLTRQASPEIKTNNAWLTSDTCSARIANQNYF